MKKIRFEKIRFEKIRFEKIKNGFHFCSTLSKLSIVKDNNWKKEKGILETINITRIKDTMIKEITQALPGKIEIPVEQKLLFRGRRVFLSIAEARQILNCQKH